MLSQIEAKDFPDRAAAKAAKAKRYFTGKPCPHGHTADRFTSNGCCVECSFIKAYNPEAREIRDQRKKFRRNLDPQLRRREADACLKRYYDRISTPEGKVAELKRTSHYWHNVVKARRQNKMEDPEYAEKVRKKNRQDARLRRLRPETKEAYRKAGKKYRLNNRDIYRAAKARRRAKKYQAMPDWLSKKHHKEINDLYKLRTELSKDGQEYHVDHIIPLAAYKNVCGLHVPWNLQLLSEEEHKKKTRVEQTAKRKDPKTGKIYAIYDEGVAA